MHHQGNYEYGGQPFLCNYYFILFVYPAVCEQTKGGHAKSDGVFQASPISGSKFAVSFLISHQQYTGKFVFHFCVKNESEVQKHSFLVKCASLKNSYEYDFSRFEPKRYYYSHHSRMQPSNDGRTKSIRFLRSKIERIFSEVVSTNRTQ